MLNMPSKVNLFGKTLDGNTNANPFQSPLSNSIIKGNQTLQPMQPQTTVAFPPQTNKSPFGQPQTQANSSIMLGGPKPGFNNPINNSNTSPGNPFAQINSHSNAIFGMTSSNLQKPSTVPFRPQQQTINSSTTNSFFNKPTVNNSVLNNQISNMYANNATNQQQTAGLFTNTQNGLINNNNNSKIFANNTNIFNQNQNQTANLQQQQGLFNNQGQQNAVFGQQQQNPYPFNQQQQANMFNHNQQNQQNFLNQNQQNMFATQQQGQFNQQQMQMQPNINMNDALSQYIHLYKEFLSQKQPFQQSIPAQHYNPQTNYQLNPQQSNGDYYMFLNNLINNEAVRRNATPRQIFEFAQGWANRMSQQRIHHNLTPEQENAQKEITKLFDSKIDPAVYQMKMKELPPIQFTMELLQKMNDPFSCKMIASQLWLRLKERFCVVMSSIKSVAPNSSNIKIKELPCYKQMLVMRKEIQNLVEKVNQLKEKDREIKRDQYQHGGMLKTVLQKYKTAFSEVNHNNKILDNANEELEKMLDYIDKNLKTIFKAYVHNETISFQDPDHFMLQVSHHIADQMNALNKMIEDHLAIEESTEQTVDFLELAGNVCNYYEEIATKLYSVRDKMKKLIQIAAQHRSYGSYQQLQARIEEKARKVMDQKMLIYNHIKDIEQILEGKSKEKKQNKRQSPTRQRALSEKKMLSLQERRPKDTAVTLE